MDIERLYMDFDVDFKTEGHKHTRAGWVNTACPHCTGDHEGYHLGWNIEEEYFRCWRCGWHDPITTISLILGISKRDSALLLQRYGINRQQVKKAVIQQEKPLILPTGLTQLTTTHKKYLRKRNFDADRLEQIWKLQSTGPLSKVENSSYKHRIFIPYYWNGELVTFDTRDVTGLAEDKYKACPIEREIIERKKIIYGKQQAWKDGIGICVEGCTDVWRLGEKAFATSGIQFTEEQVRVIAQIFKKVFICYDNEIVAQQQARKLRAELRIRGVAAYVTPFVHGDPGEQDQAYADQFVQELLSNY